MKKNRRAERRRGKAGSRSKRWGLSRIRNFLAKFFRHLKKTLKRKNAKTTAGGGLDNGKKGLPQGARKNNLRLRTQSTEKTRRCIPLSLLKKVRKKKSSRMQRKGPI